MKNDYAEVVLVLDRSGSMVSCQEEAENGINHYIDEQKKGPGECKLTLVQFDTVYEFVHSGVPIAEVPKYKLVPRGMTALLDAVGRAINETGERLSKIPEEDRPGLVSFLIVTDGLENSSHEFTKGQIKEMIERQQKEYNWVFTYLGANQDAFAEAEGMGIAAMAAASFSTKKSKEAYEVATSGGLKMRHMAASGQSVRSSFTEEDRSKMA